MLKLAVPNKGSLSEPAVTLLAEAGYRTRRTGRELVIVDEQNQVELFFLRPRDIAVYVGQGTVHAGITGRDLLLDSRTEAVEHKALGFGRSRFRFAGPIGQFKELSDIAGKRIATSYDVLVDNYLKERGVQAQVVHLDGAVESSVQLGVADLIADVVETGSTLRAARLEVFADPIMDSEAVLITTERHQNSPELATLDRRLQGVLVARSYVLVDYNVPVEALDKAIDLTPGIESPTISSLHDTHWMAVRAMVKRQEVNQIMDRLYDLGARGILVSSILACRL